MSGLPWYKRDPTAFLEGCANGNLTLEEVGAYALLIDEMYRLGRPLVDDVRHMTGVLRCDNRVWYRLRASLLRKGKIYATSGGHLSNFRVEQELKAQYDMREKKRRAGRAGGEAKASKSDELKFTEAQLSCNSSVTEAQLSPSETHKRLKTLVSGLAGATPDATVDIDKEEEVPSALVGTAVPTSIDEPVNRAVDAYNLAAKRAGWTVARIPISSQRRKLVRARLREGGMPGWLAAIADAEAQPFLAGNSRSGWTMDLKFFASAEGFTKIREGAYRRPGQQPAFDRAAALRIWRTEGYRHPQLTDDDLAAFGDAP